MRPVEAAIALLQHGDRWFLQRRAPEDLVLPGLWEFPGGKLERGEAPEGALLRELREELGWRPSAWVGLPPLTAPWGGLVLHPFHCQAPERLSAPLAWGWFTPAEVARLPIPPLNRELLRWLEQRA